MKLVSNPSALPFALVLALAAGCSPGGVSLGGDRDGADPDPNPLLPDAGLPASGRITEGLQVLYTFQEGVGATVYDQSGAVPEIDLAIGSTAAASWTEGGLDVTSPNTILASGVTRLESACQSTGALTVELWLRPASLTQAGPAHILGLSESSNSSNFYLAQQDSDLITYIRTSAEELEGPQMMESGAGALTGLSSHIVYTHSGLTDQSVLYVNGAIVTSQVMAGGFTNWGPGFTLSLANEPLGNRPWRGELHLAAVYCRALDSLEVRRNYEEGF